ncbi:unnamed protein product, partial [Tetraodon nigroviridis]
APEQEGDPRALHHHAVRLLRPGLGSGHAGRLPGVHGPAPRRLPAAVAAQMDGDAGQKLQAAHAQGIHGIPLHRRDLPLAPAGKREGDRGGAERVPVPAQGLCL